MRGAFLYPGFEEAEPCNDDLPLFPREPQVWTADVEAVGFDGDENASISKHAPYEVTVVFETPATDD